MVEEMVRLKPDVIVTAATPATLAARRATASIPVVGVNLTDPVGFAPKQQRRRALELLEASIDGCTEAIMLAYGFKTELLVELVNAGLATATIDRMVVGGRRVKVIRMRITAAGRRALAKLRWP